LNPIAHVDPFGSVILPLRLVVAGAPAFGYAKPVPVNVGRLRRPRDQGLLVSLEGPASNLGLVVVATVVLRAYRPVGTAGDIAFALGEANLLLALFNMIPLPPLDGSALVERVLPAAWWPSWMRLRQYAMAILLLLLLVAPPSMSFGRI